MGTKPDEIPLHEPTPAEMEIFELIQALLQNGGKIIRGHEWISAPEGGYFLIRIQAGEELYFFKSSRPLPFIMGPDGGLIHSRAEEKALKPVKSS